MRGIIRPNVKKDTEKQLMPAPELQSASDMQKST